MRIHSTFSEPNSSHQIFSRINISVGKNAFPDSKWLDLVVPILGNWIDELVKQIQGKRRGKYLFMDGPYYFECLFTGQQEIKIAFKERKMRGFHLIFEAHTKRSVLVSEIKRNSITLLKECEKNKFHDADVERLAMSYQKLLRISR